MASQGRASLMPSPVRSGLASHADRLFFTLSFRAEGPIEDS